MLAIQAHPVTYRCLFTKGQLTTRFVVGVGLYTQLRLHFGALVTETLQQINGIGQRLISKTILVVVLLAVNGCARGKQAHVPALREPLATL